MKNLMILLILLQLPDIAPVTSGQVKSDKDQSFFVGTYTNAESEGIYRYVLHPDGTLTGAGLLAKTKNPSFLAKSQDGRCLLAVNEVIDPEGSGFVESYTIEGNELKFMNKSPSGGGNPCFVAVNPKGFVLTANYEDGTVGLLKIGPSGGLSDVYFIRRHHGKGISDRQEGPHAHSVWFGPCENDVTVIDLGTNELWFSIIDTRANTLVPSGRLAMAPGAGPRHMAFHPGGEWGYVLNELSSTITRLVKADSGYSVTGISISTLPAGYSLPNTCSDIHISPDGRFLYASDRGHNSIAIYEVNERNGSLQLIGMEPTRGETPRNFNVSPEGDFLLVANQDSNNLVSFKRSVAKGTLEYIDEVEAPTPVCIVF